MFQCCRCQFWPHVHAMLPSQALFAIELAQVLCPERCSLGQNNALEDPSLSTRTLLCFPKFATQLFRAAIAQLRPKWWRFLVCAHNLAFRFFFLPDSSFFGLVSTICWFSVDFVLFSRFRFAKPPETQKLVKPPPPAQNRRSFTRCPGWFCKSKSAKHHTNHLILGGPAKGSPNNGVQREGHTRGGGFRIKGNRWGGWEGL